MKNIIDKALLGIALLLAIVVGPVLSSVNLENQPAGVILAPDAKIDYSILNPLNRDQLLLVIRCLTDGSGRKLSQCVDSVTQAPAVLTASYTANLLQASNIRISPLNSVNAVMNTFNVRSEVGTSQITSISGIASGTAPTTVYLYDGSTLINSKTVPTSGQVIFDNLNLIVAKDTTKTLMIRADFAANTATSGRVTMFGVTSITYARADGTNATLATGLWGPVHRLFSAIADIKLAGTPTITSQGANANGSTTAIVATFPLHFVAQGGNVLKPISDDFSISFVGLNTYTATNKSVVVIPNSDIADGASASVTVTAAANSSTLPSSGLYTARINSIRWKAGQLISVNQNWGLEDFKTPMAVQFIR